MTRLRAVIYARVSSDKQRDAHTIDSQLRSLPEIARAQGWDLVRPVDHYVDDGFTAKAGQLEAREAFQRLMRDAAAGVFDVLIVIDVDRLTRSEDAAERGLIIGAFQRFGVKISTLTSGGTPIDLQTFSGEMQVMMSALVAAEDNRKRRARAIVARRVTIERGGKPGGKTAFGMAYDSKARTWAPNATEQALVMEMYRRVADGESCIEVAGDFAVRRISTASGEGRWGGRCVAKMIRSRLYRGEYVLSGTTIAVPAIVPIELWERANAALDERAKRMPTTKKKNIYLLEGLAVCGDCGAPMGIRAGSVRAPGSSGSGRHRSRYVCANRRRPPIGEAPCGMPKVRTDDVDGRLWTALVALVSDPHVLDGWLAHRKGNAATATDQWGADLRDWRKRLRRLDDVEDTVSAQHRRGILSARAYSKELAAVAKERLALDRQIATAERAQASASLQTARVNATERLLADLRTAMGSADTLMRRRLCETLIAPGSITITREAIEGTVKLRIPAESGGAMVDPVGPSACGTADGIHLIELRIAA